MMLSNTGIFLQGIYYAEKVDRSKYYRSPKRKLGATMHFSEIIKLQVEKEGRRGGLMVSVLDFGANGPGSGPGRGHCVVFLGKTLYPHGASLYPGVQMGTSEMLGVTLRWTSIPSRGE